MATEFQVPQFTEIEDKIFGPFTLKQFIYLAGGAGAVFLIYTFSPSIILTILIAVPVGGFAMALAFYKVNERPFVVLVENFIKFHSSSRMFLWKQPEMEKKKVAVKSSEVGPVTDLPVTRDRLKELAWSLDIKEKNK